MHDHPVVNHKVCNAEHVFIMLQERDRELQGKLDELTNRIIEAQLDLKGTAEQIRGSMKAISQLENQVQQLEHHCRQNQYQRELNNVTNKQYCERCKENLIREMADMIEAYGRQTENLGVIAFLQRYWWQTALAFLVFSVITGVDSFIINLVVKYLLNK